MAGALPADGAATRSATSKIPSKTGSEPGRFDEKTSKRLDSASSATSDVYKNADGSFTRKVSEEPINYQADDGSWLPIDTNLRRQDYGGYASKENAFETKIAPDAAASQLVTLRTPGNDTVSYALKGAAKVPAVVEGSKATYSNVLEGTDLAVTVERFGVKEEIVLRERGDVNSWTFPLTLDGLTPRLAANQGVDLVDAVDGLATAQTVTDTTGGDAPRTTSTTYNSRGQADTTTDATGAVTSYDYDGYGRVVKQTDPDGQVMTTAYTPTGALLTSTLEGWTGDPNHPGDPKPLVLESRAYDPAGRLATITDAMGWTTSYTYTDNNLKATTTRSDPATGAQFVQESVGYDAAGNVVSRTTNNGKTTVASTVDASNRVTESVLDPTGVNRTTAYTYSNDDHVLQTVSRDAAGVTVGSVTRTYDPLGRVATSEIATTRDGSPSRTVWDLDEAGLARSMTDPNGQITRYAYDEAGRLVQTVSPTVTIERAGTGSVQAHPVATLGYNAFGEPVESVDPNGGTTITERDAAGRATKTRAPPYTPLGSSEPIDAVTTTVYNRAGMVTSTTDPAGKTTSYLYDQLDRLATLTAPDGGRTTFTYDALGDQLTVTDPTGAVTAKTYDFLGRPLTSSEAVRQTGQRYTTSYAYDPGDWLASTTSPGGVVAAATYDNVGETVTATDGAGNTTSYAYDGAGRLVRTTLPDCTGSGVTYDLAGRAVGTTDYSASGTALRSRSAACDAAGNLVASVDARGTTKTFGYDELGRVTGDELTTQTGASVARISYGWDANDNLTSKTTVGFGGAGRFP